MTFRPFPPPPPSRPIDKFGFEDFSGCLYTCMQEMPGLVASGVIVQGPSYIFLRCPCGCGDVLQLPREDDGHDLPFRVLSESGGPTLAPAVIRSTGCQSAFSVLRGEILPCFPPHAGLH